MLVFVNKQFRYQYHHHRNYYFILYKDKEHYRTTNWYKEQNNYIRVIITLLNQLK